jgi:cell division protein FtsN
MSPDRDDRNDNLEPDTYEEEPPRSIFAATWFRAVLILIVLGVIGAVAVPYILDAVNPPPTQQAVVKSAPLPGTPPTPSPSSPPAPSRPPAGPTPATPADDAARALPPPSTPRSTPPPAALSDTAKPAAPAAKTPGPLAKADVPAAKPSAPAKSTASGSPAVPADSTAKKPAASPPARATTKPAAKKPSEPRQVAAKTAAPAASGVYWVQVGAFKDEEAAKRLAARLREQNFKVADVTGGAPAPAASAATPPPSATTTPVPAGADQYDVFVTGPPPAELNTRLTAKGLAAEPAGAGVVIKPSLPLRDAVALSKDLAMEGYKVQVRRAGGAAATRAPARPQPAATAPAAADGLYRVRVGSFTERAAAVAALRELEAKGYKPFIARGER